MLASARSSRSPSYAATLLMIGCAGCTLPAVSLQPQKVPSAEGVVLGRVRVFKGDSEVTGHCGVVFTDEHNEPKAKRKLDDLGWVFTSIPQGGSYLSFVQCAVWNGLTYGTRALVFDVMPGRETYFGHLEFHLADEDFQTTLRVAGTAAIPAGGFAQNLLGSAVTGSASALSFAIEDGINTVTVDDKRSDVQREYESRFGAPKDLTLSLAGAALRPTDAR